LAFFILTCNFYILSIPPCYAPFVFQYKTTA